MDMRPTRGDESKPKRRVKKTVSLNAIYFGLLAAHTAFLFVFTGNRNDPVAWIIFCILTPILSYLPIASPARLLGLFGKRTPSARALAAVEVAGIGFLLILILLNIYLSRAPL